MRPEPKETCPTINARLKEIDYLHGVASRLCDSGMQVSAVDDIMSAAKESLEEMRAANSEIREWCRDWEREADDLRAERDDLQSEVGRLESEVADLRDEIERLNQKDEA